MKLIMKAITLFLGLCMFLVCITGCSNAERKDKYTEENSKQTLDFVFPKESDFAFSCTIENRTVNVGENFVINCNLTNESGRDLFIEHAVETITFSYNGVSEEMDSLAVLEKFQTGKEINRTLDIKAQKSGIITITATIHVKPAQYSDTYKTYEYNEQIEVIVN